VLHGLYWLCFNFASRSPLLLTVDDAPWVDPPSLRWLNFLATRLEELPVLLVITRRTDEWHGDNDLMRELVSGPATRVLHLAPLSDVAVTNLVRRTFAQDAADKFCRACHTVTGGNPLFVRELISALAAAGVNATAEAAERVREQRPKSVGDLVLQRLSRAGQSPPALAKALAILGRSAELRHAATLANLDPAAAAAAADVLISLQIVQPATPIDFVHPIVHAAIYSDVPHWERARLHGVAAHILAAEGRPLEEVAAHLLITPAGADPWVVAALREAAREAVGRGAPDGAIAYLRRALAEPASAAERAQVLHELGSAELLSHDTRAIEDLEKALGATPEAARRAVIASDLAMALMLADLRAEEAVGILQEATDDLAEAASDLLRSLEAQLLLAASLQPSTRPIHLSRMKRLRQMQLGDSPSERLLLANLTADALIEGRPATVVRDFAERAMGKNGELLAEVTADSLLLYLVLKPLLFADLLEEATEWFDRALVDARRRGSLLGHALTSAWRAEACYRRGALAEAEADARAAFAATSQLNHPASGVMPLIRVLIERGQLPEAESIASAIPEAVENVETIVAQYLRFAAASLAIAAGRVAEGVHGLLAIGRWCDAYGMRNPGFFQWRSAAALGLLQMGRRAEAERLASEEVALARPLEQPRTLGMALRAHALVCGGSGQIDLLREAVAILEHSPARLEHARALIDLGASLRRDGRRSDADGPLRRGLDLAHRCGATVLAERAKTELIAMGARPRRPALTGYEALTATERRVAMMACEGLSNPELAQALFVSLKTIEAHLGHVYDKLGIHSRTELPRALSEGLGEEESVPAYQRAQRVSE
jgi:DNA-binding CsgD family transcriptional regulator